MATRLIHPDFPFTDSNGDPLASGRIYFYETGTTTPKATFSDSALSTPSTLVANAIVLNAEGKLGVDVWGSGEYKLDIHTAADVLTAPSYDPLLGFDLAGILSADTYAAMTAVAKSALTDGDYRQVLGRTTRGDIEPVFFEWVEGDATSANGGTVLAADGAGTGRWIMRFEGPVNTKWFNAKVDNAADDTVAIQAALDTGLDVFLPRGTSLYDNLTSGGANQKLIGEGWASILTQNIGTGNGLTVTHDGFTVRDFRTNGDGTFEQSTGVANNDRRALVKGTGDDFTSENVLYNDGPQNCIHLDSMTGAKIVKNKFIGGVPSLSATGYQGIRVTDCSDVTVEDNLFPGGASQYVIPVFFGTFSSVNKNNTVTDNTIGGAFDNAIYLINAQGCVVTDNETTSDSSGVVVTGTSFVGGEVAGNIVTGNICHASASVGASAVGIYARDANNSIFNHNHVFDFPSSMQMAPVQHDNAGNAMSNNQMCHNVCKGWTVAGIKHFKGGLNLGDSSNNKFNDNTLIVGTATATSVAISASIAQQAAADIAFDNEYSRNTIIGSGDIGISLGFQQRFTVDGNKLTDAAIAGGTIKAAVYLPDCTEGSASGNRIKDTVGSVLLSGIDGNNTCTESDFFNNTIRGVASGRAPLKALHQSADKNSFRGNRTGADPLQGTVTMDADASTTVANDNINNGFGMVSYVSLSPITNTAGTLIGGTEGPVVRVADYVDRTSFAIVTALGGNAAGTEQLFYEIIQ